MPLFGKTRPFDRTWKAREDIHAGHISRQTGMPEKAVRRDIRDWMEASRPMQRAYFLGLLKVLQCDELLDLFSGPGVVPIALQVARRAKRVILADNDPHEQFAQLYAQYGGRLQIDSPTVVDTTIRPGARLPDSENVTLIDTGLGLPDEDRDVFDLQLQFHRRAHREGIVALRREIPHALLRGHVFGQDLPEILALLSNTRRQVFITENSLLPTDRRNDLVSTHLNEAVDQFGGEWVFANLSELDQDGLLLAQLTHD